MRAVELLFDRRGQSPSPFKAAANALLAALAFVALFWWLLSLISYQPDFSFLSDFRIRILDGLWLTLAVSLASLVVSTGIGLTAALGRRSTFLPLRAASSGYVTLIRGTPLIMQIYLFYYLVGTALGVDDRFIAGVVILSVFEGAYIAEIIRAGYESLDAEQLQAARAVGFTRGQTLRLVVLPQMLSRTLPPLTGQFSSLIKDSSLLSMISVTELMQTMREISAGNLKLIECYVFLGLLYLALTLPLMLIGGRLEKRYRL